jgi:hypothetical protein
MSCLTPDKSSPSRLVPASHFTVVSICVFLAAATFAVFGQTVHHDFINFDDDLQVYENSLVTSGLTLRGVMDAFTQGWSSYSVPLTTMSHMLDCQIFGLRPGGHHLTNVFLHAATAILLFLVLRRMTSTLWASGFVAAVFAIHPLRVESVAWVTERKDVLSGLFFMLTLAAWLRYTRKPSILRYVVAALLFALGLMSKPVLVTLPFLLLLLDYWPLARFERVSATQQSCVQAAVRLFLEKAPLLALSAVSCAITFSQQQATGTITLTETLPVSLLISNALVSYVTYIGQMFYPVRLAILYPYPESGLPVLHVAIALGLLVAISTVVFMLRKSHPWLLTGWLWYMGMLMPMIGFIQAGVQAHADRHTYLPQIGLYIMVTWEAAYWFVRQRQCQHCQSRRLAPGLLMALVITLLGMAAWFQTTRWKDSETIWSHAIACTPPNAVAQNNLGVVLGRQHHQVEAITHLKEAIAIRPEYPDAHNNLGVNLRCNGRPKEAISQFETTLAMRPGHADAMNNLAWLLATWPDASIRNGARALDLARQAEKIAAGRNPEVLDTLAAALAENGRFREASETAGWALLLASNAGNAPLVDAIRARLQLYQAQTPYRESPQR